MEKGTEAKESARTQVARQGAWRKHKQGMCVQREASGTWQGGGQDEDRQGEGSFSPGCWLTASGTEQRRQHPGALSHVARRSHPRREVLHEAAQQQTAPP